MDPEREFEHQIAQANLASQFAAQVAAAEPKLAANDPIAEPEIRQRELTRGPGRGYQAGMQLGAGRELYRLKLEKRS